MPAQLEKVGRVRELAHALTASAAVEALDDGLPHRRVAGALGVSTSALHRWATDARRPANGTPAGTVPEEGPDE